MCGCTVLAWQPLPHPVTIYTLTGGAMGRSTCKPGTFKTSVIVSKVELEYSTFISSGNVLNPHNLAPVVPDSLRDEKPSGTPPNAQTVVSADPLTFDC